MEQVKEWTAIAFATLVFAGIAVGGAAFVVLGWLAAILFRHAGMLAIAVAIIVIGLAVVEGQ